LPGIFFEPIEFLMTSRKLLGIKKRAENADELALQPVIAQAEKQPHLN
jgi:hypothetical protein